MSLNQNYPTSSFKVTVDHITTYAIFTMDLQGTITSWNEGAAQIYGWKEQEIVGKNISTMYTEADNTLDIPKKMFALLAKQGTFEDEVRQSKKSGASFTAAVTISPFIDSKAPHTKGYLLIAKDVTDRNQREEDQLSANDLLRTEIERRKLVEEQLHFSNQELDAFASAASHDLQEPLRMVMSYLQLIERRYGDMFDQDGKEFLHFAVDGAERMKTLVNDLVEYSRIDRLERSFSNVNANEVLKRVLNNMEVIISENNAVITSDPLPNVWSDTTLLSQVFQNLLINAIKFKAETPPVIHVSAQETDDSVVFAFTDNGRGIEQRHIPIIFLIFKQLGDRASRNGSGVGLALVHKIATRHKGKVWVTSKVGKGSTFYFSIPKSKEQ